MLVGPQGRNRSVATRQMINALNQIVTNMGAAQQGKRYQPDNKKSGRKRKRDGNGNGPARKISALGGKQITKKKKAKKSSGNKKSLADRVKVLEQNKPHTATYDYREVKGGQVTAAIRQAGYTTVTVGDSVAIESSLDTLKYLNDAGAVINVNIQDLAVRNEVRIVDFFAKIRLRNNFEVSAKIDVYGCVCKDTTSLLPLTCMINDDANVGITDADTNIMIYPSDFALFRNKWKIVTHQKFNLRSGDTAEMSYSIPHRDHDAELRDVTNDYQKGDFVWFVRAQGGISHDLTATSSVGTADPKVDIVCHTKWKVKYPSQANFYFIETVNNLSTQGNGAIQAGPQLDPQYT